MQLKWTRKYIALCIAVLYTGCATYTPLTTSVQHAAGPHALKMANGDMTLYVEEYASQEKAKQVFDTNVAKKGVLPLLITVENGGPTPYAFTKASFTVRDGDDVFKALSPEEAGSKAKRDAAGRALGWSLIVPIIGIPIAIISSVSHTNKVNKRIVQDYVSKAFKEGDLQPDQKQSGFLFFELPKGRNNLKGLQLDMTALNLATQEPLTIVSSLPEATFVAPEKAEHQEAGVQGLDEQMR